VWSDVSGAHRSQQQSGQLDAQHGNNGQNEGLQARGAEEVAVHQTEFHVLETELGSVAGQRLSDREIRRQTPADAAAALDDL